MAYKVGQLVRVTATFRDIAAALIDPTAVLFRARKPDNTFTTVATYGVDSALVKVGAGVYRYDLSVDQGGAWIARFYSTGAGQSSGEVSFDVEPSVF